MFLLPDTKDMKNLWKELIKLLKTPDRLNPDTGLYEGQLKIGASNTDRSEWNWYLNDRGSDNTGIYKYVIQLPINHKQRFDQFNESVHTQWQSVFYEV